MHTKTQKLVLQGGLILLGALIVSSIGGWARGASADDQPTPVTGPAMLGELHSLTQQLEATRGELAVARLQLEPMTAADLAVTANCRKQNAGDSTGAGDWTCALVWHGLDRRMLRDTYDLFVATDGCYTATAGGESLGGPMLRTADGRDVKNLLYAFEGCFDTM